MSGSARATPTRETVTLSRDGRDFVLNAELVVPKAREEVFAFFSDVRNLERITPPHLGMRTLNVPETMEAGVTIDHRIRLFGLPARWRSRIEVWEPPHRFVDVQLKGPYRRWRHEHRFEEVDGGTKVIDHVRYAVWGGALVNRFLVAPDIRRVFEYRTERLDELLG